MAPIDRKCYPCEKCDSTLTSKASFWHHNRAFHGGKVFECEQCNFSTKIMHGLERHKETAHEGIIHRCEECGKTFTQTGTLGAHKRVAHEGLLFSCDYCSHKAKRKSELLAHEAFVHLEGNAIKCRHKCSICDKRFRKKDHLNVHMQIHIGAIQPHVCSTCPKRFGANWRKKRHEETHNKLRNPTHQKIAVEMCECEVCGKELRGRRGLNKHMEIHKNEQRVLILPIEI